jgi:HD-like signal output (HDOD) protein
LFRSRNRVSESQKQVTFENFNVSRGYPKLDVREKILNKEIKLPEIPSIVFELNEVIVDPLASTDNIAQVVNKSPSLTALLLRIVNSPFYGFPSKIESISRAVTIIGTREISSLALGISMITNFEGIPKQVLDMYAFLRHGLACGIISRLLAAHKNVPQTEQLFVSGLLHDIGRLIVYKYFPDQAKLLLSACRTSNGLLYEEEGVYLGCKHTDIGKYLLKEWKLPPALESNIFYHHNPSSAPDPTSATIVHLADIIVNGLGIGSSGEILVPCLDCEAWNGLGLSPSSFDVIVGQAIHQMVALESVLEG